MNPPGSPYRILLVGNYQPDQQMSMLRYHDMLFSELSDRRISVGTIAPAAFLGMLRLGPLTKWLRYIDKYLLFPRRLRRTVAAQQRLARETGQTLLVHITDHSNAPYRAYVGAVPCVATCHDLLAVRGALGEDTDCPASRFGKMLQARILAQLRRAQLVVCVSTATQNDLARLAPETPSRVIPLALNQPYAVLAPQDYRARLEALSPALLRQPYILHVGSSLRRKNREGILRIFAAIAQRFPGQLVFAGEPLDAAQRALADSLQLSSRILELVRPTTAQIEALYNGAYAFLFPSKTEGFGWPIIEAQACGCPVLVARTTSLPEVVGAGGCLRELHDEAGFASDLLALADPAFRRDLIARGHANLARFSTPTVLDAYLDLYARLAA
jgi:glycosyltransferase involved in cell wall biosynthesis